MQSLTLDVRGMTCGHCKMSVEGALNELDGVSNVEVDLATGKVTVTYDESKVTLEAMQEAVEEQGYDVA
ncbi:copper chaperone CopZ [Ornithinibacillus sp. BX22]|uniref:Copper chaperone CopZ n=2 Tax=Ornithinibacillus TaxID=484508 RepID=A0A923L5A7_9BACI|nr:MULTISPECIES: copper chaperone CopZ [Ornithinibacillus]MBC5636768.1 copper chaperone CopZ [Ornithinibacillus hominis]MBS3681335.1 copper chaperone CopZ [Ornithinibacillus massiliensis]